MHVCIYVCTYGCMYVYTYTVCIRNPLHIVGQKFSIQRGCRCSKCLFSKNRSLAVTCSGGHLRSLVGRAGSLQVTASDEIYLKS